jgi:hypothetical protein
MLQFNKCINEMNDAHAYCNTLGVMSVLSHEVKVGGNYLNEFLDF